jgi:hypothetical protein
MEATCFTCDAHGKYVTREWIAAHYPDHPHIPKVIPATVRAAFQHCQVRV